MKYLIVILFLILGCMDSGMSKAIPANSVLIAESKDCDVVIRKPNGKTVIMNNSYFAAKAICQTYNIGDTIR